MSGVVLDILWRWRFTIMVLLMGVVLYSGYNLLSWKNSQIDAERTRATLAVARADAGDLVIANRANRDAEREKENARLRQEIKDVLAHDSIARTWADAPLPPAVIRLLQAPRQHSADPLPADTGADH